MAGRDLAFPGHLTPPDIQAYQQFSIQSDNQLIYANRIRKVHKATPLLLDGIDGRLNPESYYVKSRSATRRHQVVEYKRSSLADGYFNPINTNAFDKRIG